MPPKYLPNHAGEPGVVQIPLSQRRSSCAVLVQIALSHYTHALGPPPTAGQGFQAMTIRSSILMLAGTLFFAGCVSTAPITQSAPASIEPVSSNIPTLVVGGTPSPSVTSQKGIKPMTATLIDIKTAKGVIE